MLPHENDFLNYLFSNNYSPKTILNYRRDLDAFDHFLTFNKIDFNNINRLTVSDFKLYLRSKDHLKLFKIYNLESPTKIDVNANLGKEEDKKTQKPQQTRKMTVSNSKIELSTKTINRMLSSLRGYLRFLVVNDLECPLPPDKIDFLKREKNIMPLADYDQILKLIEAPMQYEKKEIVMFRNRAFLELLFSTGMRISEANSLNLENIGYMDKKDHKFIINEKIFVMGKGKKQRFVYLTERSKRILSEYIEKRKDSLPALFIPITGTRSINQDKYLIRVSNNYFQMKIVEYRKRIGINVRTSAHSLRHGFATFMAENGANVVALQTLLGHESLATTTKYIHSSDKLAEQTHKDFHPLGNIQDHKG